MDKQDKFIKEKLQQDQYISEQAKEVFKNFEGGIKLKNNEKPKKVIRIKLSQFVLATASIVIVGVLGGNLYAHIQGKPNIYTAVANLFNVNKEKYEEGQVEIGKTVESNGVKLTLKSAAMDDNLLILKYYAEGDKLSNEFYTYQDFEEEMIEYQKMVLTQAGYDIKEDAYKNTTVKDAMLAARAIRDKIVNMGIEEETANEILKLAEEAYQEWICINAGINAVSGRTFNDESSKEKIAQTIAMFESKVANKQTILTSTEYSYKDFEKDMIECEKMALTLADWDIKDDTYKNITVKDHMIAERAIKEKMINAGTSDEKAEEILSLAREAYKELICVNAGLSEANGVDFTEEGANEKIEKASAMFESEVASKQSRDKLGKFAIKSISQKIEKDEERYIIYSIYPVDTIADLANEFSLNIAINRIGTIEGNWNYSANIDKSKLNTRVETIDFYDDYTDFGKDFGAMVKVKRLVISDFSSAIMLQSYETNDEIFTNSNKNAEQLGLPYSYVITDKAGNVVGQGNNNIDPTTNKKYTDRIILDGINSNTDILNVKVYSANNSKLIGTIKVDINKARAEMKNTYAMQDYTFDGFTGEYENVVLKMKYPVAWQKNEAIAEKIQLNSPEDVDGNVVSIIIEQLESKDKFDEYLDNGFKKSQDTVTILGKEETYIVKSRENEKTLHMTFTYNNKSFLVTYKGVDTQYERYFSLFEKAMESISLDDEEITKSIAIKDIQLNDDDTYTISGFVLEDESKVVSQEEYDKIRNGGTITFRNETWKLYDVLEDEHLALISNSGNGMLLRFTSNSHGFVYDSSCFQTLRDYSGSYVSFTLPKEAFVSVSLGDGKPDKIALEQFMESYYFERNRRDF